MSEGSIVRRANARWGRKSLVILTTFVLLFSIAYSIPISSSTPPVKKIRIGVISGWGDIPDYYGQKEWDTDYYKKIIEPDINAYLAKLPRNRFTPMTQVEFIITSAGPDADPAVHLQMVKKFHAMGVNLIIGGVYTSQAAGSLDYINKHDMVMISPSSTGVELAISDNLFRLVPDDTGQAHAIAGMLEDKGITRLIVIQRDDNWANGIVTALTPLFSGTILTPIKFTDATTDFAPIVNAADGLYTGAAGEGVLFLSFDEKVLTAADGHNILNLEWFGADGTALNSLIHDNALAPASKVKLYSSLATATPETESSSKFLAMKTKFETLFPNELFNLYPACTIDAGWLLTLAVLETQNSNLGTISGKEIVKVLPDIASRYYGYSGWCELNAAGDRTPGNYNIWGYDSGGYHQFGMYNTATDVVTWIS
jgi:branched-chain amino acid transport system substrate-binding protein